MERYTRAGMKGPVLDLEGVSRRIGDCVAVDDARVTLRPGMIHAIVGENGAGKSTLMKMAAGVVPPTGGVVKIDGRPLDPATPAEAIRRGVGMVHQHFMLVGAFRAIENVILGGEPTTSLGRLDLVKATARAREIMESAGLTVPLDAPTASLTVGERQRLEILRVLYRGARALLLDEPTAVLSPLEAEDLYTTLRRLADGGATIAVVTHRLDEITRHADHVTVMRRGHVVFSTPQDRGAPLSTDELTRAIMGGEPPPPFAPPKLADDAATVLALKGVALADESGRALLDGIDLTVRAGEIVGVAGIEGNGQRELVRVIAGLEARAIGQVIVAGQDVSTAKVRARRALLGVVHEDRHAEGLLLDATVADNLVLGDLGDGDLDEAATVARRMDAFSVQPPDPSLPSGALSGGNQQKIVIARALDRLRHAGAKAAAVLAQPTRGVDVGAAAIIHRAIGTAAAAGMAVLVISADLGELRRLSHRIVVMRHGKIVGSLPREASETEIGKAMLGVGA
ncbi:Nucleoside ABC transporter, ATP-binding protein [Minicystis rosea]|nr:Nucleoside ABC transporter, ATP-binding protein [Minicystis rosea]